MPYIKEERRIDLDCTAKQAIAILTRLAAEIGSDSDKEGKFVGGDLNYLLSKIIWTLFEKNTNYATGAELIATLECVKQEFYRRKLAPYEEQKIAENGDVDT